MKEHKKRHILAGIRDELIVTVREKPQHTALGSTDRKGYTVEFEGCYPPKHEEMLSGVCQVEAWEEAPAEFIVRTTEEMKHGFAETIYERYYA